MLISDFPCPSPIMFCKLHFDTNTCKTSKVNGNGAGSKLFELKYFYELVHLLQFKITSWYLTFISATVFLLNLTARIKVLSILKWGLNGCTCQPGALAPHRLVCRCVIDRSEVGRSLLSTPLGRRATRDPLAALTLLVQWTWKYRDLFERGHRQKTF